MIDAIKSDFGPLTAYSPCSSINGGVEAWLLAGWPGPDPSVIKLRNAKSRIIRFFIFSSSKVPFRSEASIPFARQNVLERGLICR